MEVAEGKACLIVLFLGEVVGPVVVVVLREELRGEEGLVEEMEVEVEVDTELFPEFDNFEFEIFEEIVDTFEVVCFTVVTT